jgi:hypothetical protein
MPNAPGWYPDPTGRPIPRWWDGNAWTQDAPLPPPGYSSQFDTAPLPSDYQPPVPPERPWYGRKSFLITATILSLLIVLGVIAAVVGSAPKGSNNPPQGSFSIGRSAAVRTSTSATHSTPAPARTSNIPTQSASEDGSWVMPNEVGRVLQDAQDDVQRASGDPAFFSHSHDELGDRLQILDSNWVVCDQNVPAGQRVSAVAHIDFGVVKTDESCP